jgi:hypothetical protein
MNVNIGDNSGLRLASDESRDASLRKVPAVERPLIDYWLALDGVGSKNTTDD